MDGLIREIPNGPVDPAPGEPYGEPPERPHTHLQSVNSRYANLVIPSRTRGRVNYSLIRAGPPAPRIYQAKR